MTAIWSTIVKYICVIVSNNCVIVSNSCVFVSNKCVIVSRYSGQHKSTNSSNRVRIKWFQEPAAVVGLYMLPTLENLSSGCNCIRKSISLAGNNLIEVSPFSDQIIVSLHVHFSVIIIQSSTKRTQSDTPCMSDCLPACLSLHFLYCLVMFPLLSVSIFKCK